MNQNIKITVPKAELIKHLKANKEAHIQDFTEAKEEYLKRVKTHLQDALANANDGIFMKNNFNHNNHQPIDKSKEYDKYIGMLEMAKEDELTIDTEQYECFVNDEWHWIAQSKTISQMYKGR